jgi:hypothetical protein
MFHEKIIKRALEWKTRCQYKTLLKQSRQVGKSSQTLECIIEIAALVWILSMSFTMVSIVVWEINQESFSVAKKAAI